MKSLVEFINESVSLGKQLEDELNKEVVKMKLTTNYAGDCLAIITDKGIDLDAFTTNIASNLLTNSDTYEKLEGKTKYFGMYNASTKKTTVWVGLEKPITDIYNNLKKDRTIKLTELF